ncbi:uncharacterized protein BO80DRAFT_417794 [Aspergillus ibericus CBS 121593]|uniref:Rhodopsin domain-containing protein n=1 Tax=Aspergillus ibericus CBS 121593 TaxID=1448316 RepID=A0A395GPJ8_9EURO|nr:hypothetical protein BO80DRAFT_417794 [Aspergillus ibericus CBS 121593]RAK95953.1 hypothetical protein BO80DRAFT_417794 [Aspergillus ibericus CBS 121593]
MSTELSAASRGPSIIAGNLTVAIIATVAVGLRVLARSLKSNTFGLDDWLIFLALPFGWGMAIATIIAVQHGLGQHLTYLEAEHPGELLIEGQAYWASEIIWTLSIPLIKSSILLLYIRIFGKVRHFRMTAYALGTFSVCWAIMVLLVIIFQCHPVEKAWAPATPGHCINSWLFFVIGSSMNCATDIAILVLPIPSVWRLHLSRMQRVSLVGIFLLGSLSCVFGLVRLGTMISERNSVDATWALANVAIWSTAEPCLGITAACLPTLRPLFAVVYGSLTTSGKSVTGSRGTGAGTGTGRQSGNFGGHDDFQPLSEATVDADIEALERDSVGSRTQVLVPMKGINVKTSTEWKVLTR